MCNPLQFLFGTPYRLISSDRCAPIRMDFAIRCIYHEPRGIYFLDQCSGYSLYHYPASGKIFDGCIFPVAVFRW
jgi:hypothetical protein